MNLAEFRSAVEAKQVDCDLAVWLTHHLQLDSALRRAFRRWGLKPEQLVRFIYGRDDLSLAILVRIAKDTGIKADKLILQYSLAALTGGGPPVGSAAEETTPLEERPEVTVDVTLYRNAGQYYKPDDFSPDGMWLRAAPNKANEFGDWMVERATGQSIRPSTGVQITHGPDVIYSLHPAHHLPEKHFNLSLVVVHAIMHVRIVVIRPGEGRGPLTLRPGERICYVRFGTTARTILHTSKGRARPNHEKKEATTPQDGGLCVYCGTRNPCARHPYVL